MEELFDSTAEVYDHRIDLLSLTFDSSWRGELVNSLGVTEGDKVLDLATGTARSAKQLLAKVGCTIVGVDISRGMLRKVGDAGEMEGFLPVQGDAMSLPFRDDAFDRLMISYGLRNMPDIGLAIDEAHRVLKVGGRMGILVITIPHAA